VEFPAEMIIHSPCPKNLDKPGVWLFPKLTVCMDCGFSRFTVPESELVQLATTANAKEVPPLDQI
jgi:hypothetical protein